MNRKPVIAITMGDPCGIGPEITVKALCSDHIYDVCEPVLIGDKDILRAAADISGISEQFEKIISPHIYHVKCDVPEGNILGHAGKVNAFAGKAAYDCIARSVDMCLSKEADCVATAPINKQALKAAGIKYIGHTEIYAALTDTKDPLTMFDTNGLRVFFLTRHVSLKDACTLINKELILSYIQECTAALKRIGVNSGSMAVAALNPHGGEHGLFGREEDEIIRPAVEAAKLLGYSVEGPISADSVFHLAHIGRYNSVLSLYHDQGHIATKTLDFEGTISVTHCMPFLRTSVDHGTAFDIAWKDQASEVSMIKAVELGAKYAY